MMSGNRMICLSALLLCLLWHCSSAAQIKTVPKEKLDSLANPLLAEDSRFMEFSSTRLEAAGVREKDRPVYSFSFVNRWDMPLVVERMASTCGCAVPSCAQREIQPGGSGSIDVAYYPEGHPGKFRRRVFVYTNLSSSHPSAVLELDVTVVDDGDRARWFPVPMGQIRMKTDSHRFRSSMKDIVELAFINVGDTPVTPEPMNEFLPPFVRAWCETPSVNPGEEGRISISFDPEKYAEHVRKHGRPGSIPLMLGGVGASPKTSAVTLTVE